MLLNAKKRDVRMFNRGKIRRLEYKIKGRDETIAQLHSLLDKVTNQNRILSSENTKMRKAVNYYVGLVDMGLVVRVESKPATRPAILVDGFLLRRRND